MYCKLCKFTNECTLCTNISKSISVHLAILSIEKVNEKVYYIDITKQQQHEQPEKL